MASYLWLALMPVHEGYPIVLCVQVACASSFVFGLTSVYFTLLDEAALPQEHTGAVVGIVCTLGFLPDIFVGPLAGLILDSYPGDKGYRLLMFGVACVGLVGLLATIAFTKEVRKHGRWSI